MFLLLPPSHPCSDEPHRLTQYFILLYYMNDTELPICLYQNMHFLKSTFYKSFFHNQNSSFITALNNNQHQNISILSHITFFSHSWTNAQPSFSVPFSVVSCSLSSLLLLLGPLGRNMGSKHWSKASGPHGMVPGMKHRKYEISTVTDCQSRREKSFFTIQ